MNATLPNPAATPIVPAAALRRLPMTAAASVLGVAAITAAVGVIAGRADWWAGFGVAFVIAAIAAAASVAVLNVGRGKTVDWLVTLTMAATLARMAVSAAGLLVAMKLLRTPPEVTAFSVCGYYAAMLIAETTLLTRAAATPSTAAVHAVGGTHA